ncbi:MAG: hypothetical protein E7157_02635 [Lactobacillales bacterium]|nr:hypothetical protein [Lactobacillales bacterium]
MKKKIIISLVMLLSVGIITGCGCNKKKETKEEKKTYNTNEGVIEDKEVEGLKLTNTSLVSTKNGATLVTAVTNPTKEDKEVRIFNIYVKDKEGNTIVTLQGYVGGVVPAGETREITSNVDMNLDKAHKVEYEILK